jgi:hypothetical protein
MELEWTVGLALKDVGDVVGEGLSDRCRHRIPHERGRDQEVATLRGDDRKPANFGDPVVPDEGVQIDVLESSWSSFRLTSLSSEEIQCFSSL